jgi:hypothetical protein
MIFSVVSTLLFCCANETAMHTRMIIYASYLLHPVNVTSKLNISSALMSWISVLFILYFGTSHALISLLLHTEMRCRSHGTMLNSFELLYDTWSNGQSSWLHNGDVLCFLWGTNWICICYVEESRPPLWSTGQSTWLQIQRYGFDSHRYQIFREVLGLEHVHSASWVQLRSYLKEK